MKRCFVRYFLTKITLAAVAAAVALLAPAPVHATSTAGWHGGNWSSFVGLTTNVIQYPDGITSSTTPAEATNVARTIACDYKSVGINFVRFPVNPATVTGNWQVTQACIDELLAEGLTVNIGCWYVDDGVNNNGTGLIPNINTWSNMWKTVDGVYGGNNNVYYEPVNEPWGYSESGLLNVYTNFLGYSLTKSPSYYILDISGNCTITNIGTDSHFNSCYLCWHNYAAANRTNTIEDTNYLYKYVGHYASRTVMNEMGAITTNGLDYLDESTNANYNIVFVRAMCAECSSWPMGFAWFPAHQTRDANGANDIKVMFNGAGEGVVDPSLIPELQYGWGLNAVWSSSWDNPAGGSDFTTAFAACSWGPEREDVFGVETDGNIYHTWWFDNSGWNTWEEHECPMAPTNGPAASANNAVANREDLYYIGADGNLYHQYYDGAWEPSGVNSWNEIEAPAGVTLVGTPSASSWGAGEYDVYARGTDNHVYHAYSTDGITYSWDDQGGTTTNNVASCSWGTNRLDAFAIGTGNGQLWHQYWNGSWHPSQTTWQQDIPETSTEYALGACCWGTNRIDLFDNTGSAIGHAWYDFATTNGSPAWVGQWTQTFTPPTGVTLVSAPCATSWAPNRIDVFVLGSDGKCYHLYFGI